VLGYLVVKAPKFLQIKVDTVALKTQPLKDDDPKERRTIED
jgi:hypothetical protein